MSDSVLEGAEQSPGKDISRSILAEQVKLAFGQINFGFLTTFLCAIAYLIVAWGSVSRSGLITWFVALTALTFIRYLSSRIFFRKKPGAEEAFRWNIIFCSGSFLSGFLWGMAGIFLFPENSISHQVFLILLVAGLSAGTVSVYTALKWAAPLFILPSIGILTVKVFTISGDIYQAMGAVMILFIFAMLGSAKRTHKAMLDTLNLRFENVDLIAQLEKANKKFHQLSDATFEGVLVHDKGEIFFTNDILTEMFGYTTEEVVGLNALDFVAPEQRDFAKEKMLSGHEEPYETVGINKEGLRIPIEIHGKPVPYEDRIVRMAAIRNLTQRDESETALRESEERYRELFENANDLYYTTDIEGNFTSVNKAILDTLGYRRDELLGNHYSKIVPPELTGKAGQMTRRKLDGKENTRYELELISQDGRKIPIELSSKLILMDGAPVGVQGAARDITERKEVEQELKNSESRLRHLADAAFEAILIHENGVLLLANDRFYEMFQHERHELAGKQVIPLTVAPESIEFFKKQINAGIMQSYESVGLRKDGSRFPMEIKVRTSEFHGRPVRIAAINDITERKLAEEKLTEAKDKAEEATKLKDKFVSLVAHDLKTPFNSILGFLALLDSEKAGPLSLEQKEMTHRALIGGEKLVQMIDDLLDLSLLQTGKLTLQRLSFSAREVIDGVIEDIGYMAESKNIEVIIEAPISKKVYADLKLFHGVIRNLLSNAIKFCEEGGSIRIFILDGKDTTIAVSDTGAGIPSDIIDDIFKHEIKTTTKGTSGEEGTGFGLPFCHDVMEAHGGSIRVESVKGEGAVFYAYFPHKKS